jgi:uncharacterized membrane protein
MPKDKEYKDYITNKIMAVFSACMIGLIGLMNLRHVLQKTPYWSYGLTAIKVLLAVGVVLVVLSLLLFLKQRKNAPAATKVFTGKSLLIGSVVFTLMMAIIQLDPDRGIELFYIVLPAIAIYYLIYHSYQAEFFVIAADCGLGALALYATRKSAAH